MNIDKTQLYSAVVIAVAFVLGAWLIGSGIRQGKDANTITSTGSAKIRVEADTGKLTGDMQERVMESNLKSGYDKMARSQKLVQEHLTKIGFKENEITFGSVYASEVWNENRSAPRQYDLRQTVSVSTSNIGLLKKISESTSQLIAQGVLFQPYSPEYYYSKLADLRVQLLGDAIKDSKARATEIAKSAGNRVGKLKSASSGVVQVLAPNSVSVDDYGSYDTSTPQKDVMVTVRASFSVK